MWMEDRVYLNNTSDHRLLLSPSLDPKSKISKLSMIVYKSIQQGDQIACSGMSTD